LHLIIALFILLFNSIAHSADFGQLAVNIGSAPNISPIIYLEDKRHVLLEQQPLPTKFRPIPTVQPVGVIMRVPKPAEKQPVVVQENKVVYFPLGKSIPKGGDDLRPLSTQIPSIESIRVKGYTCDTGSKEANDRLALKRAIAVSKLLQELGVPQDKLLEVDGIGKCCYKASPAESRRVEITINKLKQP